LHAHWNGTIATNGRVRAGDGLLDGVSTLADDQSVFFRNLVRNLRLNESFNTPKERYTRLSHCVVCFIKRALRAFRGISSTIPAKQYRDLPS